MSDDSKTRKLLEDAAQRGIAYREICGDRSVAPSQDAAAAVSRFIEPLPANGCDDAEVIAMLDEIGSPASVAMAGPRFFGFVIGSSLPVTVATNWLSTAWDQNVVMHEVTPATATLEQVALDWLTELFGLPAGTGGGFVTGATVANFTALAAARHRVFADAGWNVESDGLIGAPPVTLIVSDEAHPTLFKSLGMLGLGRDRVIRIPTDDQGRMIAAELPAIKGPAIVCTQAGNINTGAVDPIGEICDAVKGSGAWVHVDGAFGLMGGRFKYTPFINGRHAKRGLVGNRCAQVAERSLRQWHRICPQRGGPCIGYGDHGRLSDYRNRTSESVRLYARVVTPGAWHRHLGGTAFTRQKRCRETRGWMLRTCAAIRSWIFCCRLRRSKRRCA